jgi:hypothetical protein
VSISTSNLFSASLVILEESASALYALGCGFDSIPRLYPERIKFVLGTAGFLLSCLSSLFALGTIRSRLLQFPLSNLFTHNKKDLLQIDHRQESRLFYLGMLLIMYLLFGEFVVLLISLLAKPEQCSQYSTQTGSRHYFTNFTLFTPRAEKNDHQL